MNHLIRAKGCRLYFGREGQQRISVTASPRKGAFALESRQQKSAVDKTAPLMFQKINLTLNL
jgi:uncharacterized protein YkuJ